MIESRRQTGQWRRIAPPPGSTQSTSRLFCAAESEINRIVTLGAVPGRTLPRSKPERSPRLLNEVSTGIEYRLPPGSCRVRRWPVNYRKLTRDLAQDEEPFLRIGQLLRSIANCCQERANCLQRRAHLGSLGVHAGDSDGGCPGVSGLLADGIQQIGRAS